MAAFNSFAYLGTELLLQLPQAEPHVYTIFKISVILWGSLGFSFLNFIYRLLHRKNDFIYYAVLILSVTAIIILITRKDILTGYTSQWWGYSVNRNGLKHILLTLPDIAGGIISMTFLLLESNKNIPATLKKIYFLILIGASLTLGSILFFNIILPDFYESFNFPQIGSAMSSLFMFFIMLAINKFNFLNISVESKADDIFEYFNDAIILVNQENTINKMNLAARNLFNIKGMYTDKNITSLLPDNQSGKVNIEINNRNRIISISSYTIPSEITSVYRVLVLRDITAKQKAYDILKDARNRLEEQVLKRTEQFKQAQRLEALATISEGISSEFTGFIIRALGASSMALEKLHPTDPLVEDLQEITFALQNGRRLVKQIKQMRVKDCVDKRKVSLVNILKECITLAKASSASNIKIVFTPQKEFYIYCDEGKINQVILNIITNAAQAVEPKTGIVEILIGEELIQTPFKVTLGSIEKGTYTIIKCNDNGYGMDRETQKRIFEPFFTTKKQGSGTGLGLSNVSKIIEEHNSAIDVKSEPGIGTTFTIYFNQSNHIESSVN
ncbi:MAG: hypothetical protein JXR91_16615 [Deltaproteobacteria bacterium]|nr:hypothetical protein [Deltaproteobacteria bacterium]